LGYRAFLNLNLGDPTGRRRWSGRFLKEIGMRRRVVIAVIAAAGGLVASASASPVAAEGQAMTDRMVSSLNVQAQSEARDADGTVTDTWMVQGSPVSVEGPAHMTVTADMRMVKGHERLVVSATPPPIAASAVARLASTSYPIPYRSWCITDYPNNDGEVHGCDYQQIIYESGSTFYLSDKLTESSHYGNGFFDRSLLSELIYISWPTKNVIVDWSPTSSNMSVGSCSTAQVGIAYYLTVNVSWTVCPNNWGLLGISNTVFGVVWNGDSQSWEGVDGVDAVYNPSGASRTATLNVSWAIN
jgi:hypothetical protein